MRGLFRAGRESGALILLIRSNQTGWCRKRWEGERERGAPGGRARRPRRRPRGPGGGVARAGQRGDGGVGGERSGWMVSQGPQLQLGTPQRSVLNMAAMFFPQFLLNSFAFAPNLKNMIGIPRQQSTTF